MKNSYSIGQKFNYNGTIYVIKSVTSTALEIASQAGQSLWVAISEFERLLGIKGKSGFFTWYTAQIRD